MASVFSDPVVVIATKHQVSCPLGEDTIILDMKAGLYFSLDNVGAKVWELIQQPRSVSELREPFSRHSRLPRTCVSAILKHSSVSWRTGT